MENTITKKHTEQLRQVARLLDDIWLRLATLRMETKVDLLAEMILTEKLAAELAATAEEWAKVQGRKQ